MAQRMRWVVLVSAIMMAFVNGHPLSPRGGGGGLNVGYYARTCPKAMDIIRQGVEEAMQKEVRMGASLLRLHFHDCFVQGCGASLLLDNNTAKGIVSEKNSNPNKNSARGFEVLDTIKSRLDAERRARMECATGEEGLQDRKPERVKQQHTGTQLDSPVTKFKVQGLNEVDLVALSGSHTIGQSRCTSFRQRVYNRTSYIQQSFYQKLTSKCPLSGGDNNLSPLDFQTPTKFDGSYFVNLLRGMGLLHTDEVLAAGDANASKQVAQRISSLVRLYANNEQAFLRQFAESMVKMGSIRPLLSPNGEVRTNCRSPN